MKPTTAKAAGKWRIHVVKVRVVHGRDTYRRECAKFFVDVSEQATVKELLKAINACPDSPRKGYTITDLTPFDPSTIGHTVGGYNRRGEDLGPQRWVSCNPDAKPNCSWEVDVDKPETKILDAGLCDEAVLAVHRHLFNAE